MRIAGEEAIRLAKKILAKDYGCLKYGTLFRK